MAYVASLAINVTRGEDRAFAGTHQTSGTDSTAVNITGWTMVFTARDLHGVAWLSKTVSVTVGASGTYSFSVTASDLTVSSGNYPCDIWRTDSGNATIMGIGLLTVAGDVRV